MNQKQINLIDFLNLESKNNIVYPSFDNIFNAFKYFNFEDLNVVIIGQDPYHQPKSSTWTMFFCFK